MANTVGGLRSIQSTSPRPTYDRGQRPIDTGESRPVQLRPVAAPVNRYAPPPVPSQDTRLKQLADALSSLNPVLQAWGSARSEQKTNEQKLKIPAYLEQIKRDWKGGKIDAVQIGKMFPETVPAIRMSIAEAYGEKSGTDAFSKVVEAVNNSEDLRFNTDKRKEFIEGERKRLFAEIGGDNDFYSSGFVSAFDKSLASWDLGWQRQTADKHMEVLGDKFNEEAFNAYVNGGAGALLQVDATWDKIGGLHRTTRNKIVVDRITQEAYDRGDPSLLDRLPARFLNSETKVALSKGKAQIEQKNRSDWSFGVQLQNQQREEQSRANKTAIIEAAATGKPLDPKLFKDDPETFGFAVTARERDWHTTPKDSAARTTQIKEAILLGATFGDTSRLGIKEGDFNLGGLSKRIHEDSTLTNADAQSLLKELPKLLEGASVMESPVVKEMFNLSLKPMLMSLDSTAIAKINQSLGGTKNIHAEANKVYLKHVHMMTQAHYSETGEWPKYHQMLKIAQSAVEVTNNFVLPLTDIRNLGAARQSLQTGATSASPASAASAPASAPHSNTLPVPDKSPLTPEQSAVLRRRTNVQRPNL